MNQGNALQIQRSCTPAAQTLGKALHVWLIVSSHRPAGFQDPVRGWGAIPKAKLRQERNNAELGGLEVRAATTHVSETQTPP